jgi:DNA-binding MarR family transcriptional regulator
MEPNLAFGLVLAADWFNDAITERMVARGFPRLSRTQALVMGSLTLGPARPADLARRLDVTRQAMQQLLGQLVDAGLVEVRPDPSDRRATIVSPTSAADAFGMAAAEELARLEAELASRIGRRRLDALRAALASDWGPPPT